jgi:hypothetical protein
MRYDPQLNRKVVEDIKYHDLEKFGCEGGNSRFSILAEVEANIYIASIHQGDQRHCCQLTKRYAPGAV